MRSVLESTAASVPEPGTGFMAEAETVLAPLRGARIPLTLMSLRSHQVAPGDLFLAAQRALSVQGLIDWLPDGSVGFLYIGPHAGPAGRGAALAARVAKDVAHELERALPGQRMDLSIRCVGLLSDEVATPVQLVEALRNPDAIDLFCPDLEVPAVLYGTTRAGGDPFRKARGAANPDISLGMRSASRPSRCRSSAFSPSRAFSSR
jgi:hypothetical protein